MRPRSVLAAFVALLALAVGVYFLFARGGAAEPAGGSAVYESEEYGYSYTYDDSLQLNVFTPEYQTLEDTATQEPNELVQIAVEHAGIMDEAESFDAYAMERAKVYCAADGPGGSLYCTRVTRSDPFTTNTGLLGVVFYLEMVHERRGESTTTREAGPFYAFNISLDSPGSGYSALIIRPAQFYSEGEMYDRGASAAYELVNTLRIE